MAQADQIAFVMPKTRWHEGSAFNVVAYFRLRSTAAAATPTSIKYRLDCLTTGMEILDWTTVSAASSATIAVTGAQNVIQNDGNDYEVKQLTVMLDEGLATQHRGRATWRVENLYNSP